MYVVVKLVASLNVPDGALHVALVAEPPIIPLKFTVFPTQTEVLFPAFIVGVALTSTVIVVVEAHWLGEGVNVYNVVAVLFIAGAHVPVIPFKEVVGNEIEPPEQIGVIWVKVGVTNGFIVIDNVVELAH